MHTPLTSHRSSASEGSIHMVLAVKDSRWQGKCTNVSLRLWLIADSPSTLPAAGRPAVCPERQGGGASLVGFSASFLSCFVSKPKPTHPSKMVSNVSYLLMPPWMALTTHFHSFSLSPLTLLSLLSHLMAFGTSVCHYCCTNQPHLDKHLEGRD